MTRPCALLVVALATGCASTQLTSREITRLGPLRDAPVRPAAAAREPVHLEAGSYALDDDELARMRSLLAAHFEGAVDRAARAHAPSSSPRGTARVQRCQLKASPTPRATVYFARCRVALEVDGVPLVEVEAVAERRARARAVDEGEAARIRELVRNPLLDFDDSRLALEAALDEAARLLVSGEAAAVPEGHPPEVVFDVELMRRDALRRLARDDGPALAAACVDLGRFGTAADAPALVPHLDDELALVRLAAATSLGELGSEDAYPPLAAHREDPDEKVQRAVALALKRLRALYPRLPRDDDAAASSPSKSSTEGGGL